MSGLRYALRSLVRARWFTVAAVCTFALGIGVNVAVFSAIDRLLFRPLPYGNVDELVLFRSCGETGECFGGFPSVVAFEGRGRLTLVDDIAVAAMPGSYAVAGPSDDERPVRLTGASSNLLRVLRVSPVLGRDFRDEDAAMQRRVALISHETWRRRFGAAPGILGTALGHGANRVEVIGVLPPDFIPPTWTAVDPAWDGLVLDPDGWAAIGPSGMIAVPVARLAPGATLEAARAEVAALVTSLAPQLRGRNGRLPTIRIDPVQEALFSRFSDNAWLVLSASVVLLLLACANLANLLLARGRSREYDAAIHASLGASPGRLMGTAMIESALVCAAGSAIAVATMAATSRWMYAALPPLLARYATEATDPRLIAVTLGAAFASALAAGVTPAWRVARVDVLSVLRRASNARQRSRLRSGRSLLVVESALAVLLVLSGLLLFRSFTNFSTEDLGFVPEDLYLATVRPAAPVKLSPEDALAAYERTLETLSQVPGTAAVGGADATVMSGTAPMRGISISGQPRGGRYQISAGYFAALGTTFMAGRAFTEPEIRHRARVAILSASAARHFFPDLPAIQVVGRGLTVDAEPHRTVVGVVPDHRRHGYGSPSEAAVFLPLGAEPSSMTPDQIVIRMQAGAAPQRTLIQERLRERMGEVTVSVTSMSARLEPALKDPRFRAVLFAVLALSALLLAAIGLYAIASLDVAQRRHEMGVRLALGARGRDVGRMVAMDACRPVIAGILVGVAGAYWAEKFLVSFMYGVEPRDPLAYVTVIATLFATALAAAWLPARRAALTDPATVLRGT